MFRRFHPMASRALVASVLLLSLAGVAQAQHRHRSSSDRGPRTVSCASVDNKTHYCRVSWDNARLAHRDSRAACVRGKSWGFHRGAIWVAKGCRAQFAPARSSRHDSARHDRREASRSHHDAGRRHSRHRDIRLSCASHDYAYRRCRAEIHRGAHVVLTRQESSSACVRGRSWGWDRDGIWVNHGCSAHFVVRYD
ncbi:MAG TPA: DUF3011 domain-containing protein [Rhodanobacteraceae bacterium]|nr:DUF3011 domain-containing protein [Rhodanobacteraceae bacterium]